MKFYAYKPTADGREPVGGSNRLLFELKTKAGALRHAVKWLGPQFRLFMYTNFYDEKTWREIGASSAERRANWPKAKTEVDTVASGELLTYIVNDQELYRLQQTVERNLMKFRAKGTYLHSRAVDGYAPLVEAGAKKYVREFGGTWHTMFDVPTRRDVAEELARLFAVEAELGNMDHLLPAKGRKANAGGGWQHRVFGPGQLETFAIKCGTKWLHYAGSYTVYTPSGETTVGVEGRLPMKAKYADDPKGDLYGDIVEDVGYFLDENPELWEDED